VKDVLGILRRELFHLLRAIENLNTDHGIHGYRPARPHEEDGTRP
jgi:hypothetical protein